MDIFPLAQPHDHLARHFLVNVDLTADFLMNYVDRGVVDKLDLDRLQVESPVNVSSFLAERLGDLRFSTGFRGSGRKLQVLI
ncbi:MAG: Rpn family recombination-promoting nuclease/putative transposase, partial [Planctomycetota bacterium]|nr:Rpn family recombination-promoting nuclease/putative transposase [Planctomycetota bacterium]